MVVGRVVAAPHPLDRSGRTASFEVERVLAGERTTGSLVRIAWEELAAARPDRFDEDERLLVALEPVPGASLWRQRLPDGQAELVAGDGRAFLRVPDAATIEALARWLALAPAERDGASGVAALADLVARGEAGLAGAAVTRLGGVRGLSERLEEAMPSLARAVGDPTRPLPVRRALLSLIGTRRLGGLREPVARVAAEPEDAARAEALAALAALDGGLPEARVAALLESEDAAVRAAAVRAGTLPRQRIEALLARDGAPEVRAAALEALLDRRGVRALPAVRMALFDADPGVRELAIRRIGGLGAPVVPELETMVARERDPEQVRAPLAALALAGPDGRAALARVAGEHEAERVRALARLFLGLEPWPGH